LIEPIGYDGTDPCFGSYLDVHIGTITYTPKTENSHPTISNTPIRFNKKYDTQ